MKKFLDALNESKKTYIQQVPTDTEAQRKFRELRSKYSKLVGQRALYKCKATKESRVVTIDEATPNYVRLAYKYYTLTGEGTLYTCVTYGALVCGEDYLGDAE